MSIGTLWVKCNHFTVEEQHILSRGQRYKVNSEYDWCPICHREMEEKRDQLQTSFDSTFGVEDGS